jgi:hypothetical protein
LPPDHPVTALAADPVDPAKRNSTEKTRRNLRAQLRVNNLLGAVLSTIALHHQLRAYLITDESWYL